LGAIKKITWFDGTENDGPAAVEKNTGHLYLNRPVFNRLTKPQKAFVKLHEEGHVAKYTNSEFEADEYAFKKFADKGYSLRDAVKALTQVLTYENPEHKQRTYEQIFRALRYDWLKNKNKKAKNILEKYGMSMCENCDNSNEVKKEVIKYLGNDKYSRELMRLTQNGLVNIDSFGGKIGKWFSKAGDNIEKKIDDFGDTKVGDAYKANLNVVTFGIAKPGYVPETQFAKTISGIQVYATDAITSAVGAPGVTKGLRNTVAASQEKPPPDNVGEGYGNNGLTNQEEQKKQEEEAAAKKKKEQTILIIIAVVIVVLVGSILIFKNKK
jgi:vacuolar-type H+-ATPase subunit I/STV1